MGKGLKNQVFLEAMRLKKSGLENDVIHARLEKKGVPEGMINHVIKNISMQNSVEMNKERAENQKLQLNTGLIRIGAGLLLAVASYILFPGFLFLPIVCVALGAVLALRSRSK